MWNYLNLTQFDLDWTLGNVLNLFKKERERENEKTGEWIRCLHNLTFYVYLFNKYIYIFYLLFYFYLWVFFCCFFFFTGFIIGVMYIRWVCWKFNSFRKLSFYGSVFSFVLRLDSWRFRMSGRRVSRACSCTLALDV